MRRPAILILLLSGACANSPVSVPRSSTVFVAPTVHPGYADNSLARALVAELDRTLRLGIDMVHVDAAHDADYVVQPVVSFAAVEVESAQFYGHAIDASWKETLIGSVTVTARTDPTHPRILQVRQTAVDSGFYSTWVPLPILLRSIKGCRIDAATGAVTTADGSPAWLPGIMYVNGRSGDVFRRLRLPTTQIPPHEFDGPFGSNPFHEDPGDDVVWRFLRTFTPRAALDAPGPGSNAAMTWRRLQRVLLALVARERLRDESLDEADRRRLSSLLDWIAYPGDEQGRDEHAWQPASSALLHHWLVARLRDDHEAFRAGYTKLVAAGTEPEFCKAIYVRWPPNPDVFGNAPISTDLHATRR